MSCDYECNYNDMLCPICEQAETDRLTAEIERLRAALDPFARHAHCTDQIQRSSLALWCAQALNAICDDNQQEKP